MWTLFERLFASAGFVQGIVSCIGQMTFGEVVNAIVNNVHYSCVNFYNGNSFTFSFGVFSFVADVVGNSSVFTSLIRSLSLFASDLLTPLRMVFGLLVTPVAALFPSAPAFVGLAIYFIFIVGAIRAITGLVSRVISLFTGTIFGKS